MNTIKKNRIIFLDLMRAFAVLQMVQGHTVDVLLSDQFRTFDSPEFAFWAFMRGLTAPIFLFTAGTVFTYLFRLRQEPFETNPRMKKGFKRVLLLVSLGYLLRYPTPNIFKFSNVSQEQWNIFFAVDVLQLIGFGILFVILLLWLSEKFNNKDYLVFSAAALIFFGMSPLVERINWINYLPLPLAGYFYKGTGSNFPLFPWAGYVIAGGVLGSYLAKYPDVFKSLKFSIKLALFGFLFIAAALIGNIIETSTYGQNYFWTTSPNLIFFRLGLVLLLNSAISFISLKANNIPRFIVLIGRSTLLIYVVHLIILYGSAWNPGLIALYDKSLSVGNTIGMAFLMICTMAGMVLLLNVVKVGYRRLVTSQ